MRKKFIFMLIFTYLITGCSSKDQHEYNKPAIYWYNKMIKQLSNYQIDEADDTYTSLEAEHRNSSLLPSAIMIIATAHMEDEEYLMANYYLDQYLKKFSKKDDIDYIRYLKIKSNFLAFKSQFREQDLLSKTLKQTDKFIHEYPNSKYIYIINTIRARLLMKKAIFDKEISELYGRVDKPKAQKVYEKKASTNWEDLESIEKISVPWYRYIFE